MKMTDCISSPNTSVANPWHFGVDPDPDLDRGSMALTNGSGSGCGSCYFRYWPSRCQKKLISKKVFFCLLLFEGTFFKDKKSKRSNKSRNQGFSHYICLVIEGFGSGSIPLTNGSGSGSRRPKNIWIWRIRISNTAINTDKHLPQSPFTGQIFRWRPFALVSICGS